MQLKPPAIGLHSDFVIGQTPNASMNPETVTRDSEFLKFKDSPPLFDYASTGEGRIVLAMQHEGSSDSQAKKFSSPFPLKARSGTCYRRSDDDPSGIATYTIAGAQLGTSLHF